MIKGTKSVTTFKAPDKRLPSFSEVQLKIVAKRGIILFFFPFAYSFKDTDKRVNNPHNNINSNRNTGYIKH